MQICEILFLLIKIQSHFIVQLYCNLFCKFVDPIVGFTAFDAMGRTFAGELAIGVKGLFGKIFSSVGERKVGVADLPIEEPFIKDCAMISF